MAGNSSELLQAMWNGMEFGRNLILFYSPNQLLFTTKNTTVCEILIRLLIGQVLIIHSKISEIWDLVSRKKSPSVSRSVVPEMLRNNALVDLHSLLAENSRACLRVRIEATPGRAQQGVKYSSIQPALGLNGSSLYWKIYSPFCPTLKVRGYDGHLILPYFCMKMLIQKRLEGTSLSTKVEHTQKVRKE
jgi:hypothetical protein